MPKNLQLIRHSHKNGEHISEHGFDTAPGNLLYPDTVTDVFCGSALGCTTETALVVVSFYGLHAKIHPVDERFGSSDLFQAWVQIGFKQAVEKYGNSLVALKNILGPMSFQLLRKKLMAAVESCFVKIKRHGLIFGHSPLIELIAEIYGNPPENFSLEPNQGILLMYSDYEIHLVVP